MCYVNFVGKEDVHLLWVHLSLILQMENFLLITIAMSSSKINDT